jgi:hypothetical protein
MIEITREDYKLAAENGIPKDLVNKRVREYKNWSKNRILTQPPKKYNGKLSIWWDYRNIAVVTRSTFEYRLKQGMPPELAATKPPGPTAYRDKI